MGGAGGVFSNQSAEFLSRFTRQSEAYNSLHSGNLVYYNNSEMVGQAIKAEYVDKSSLNDQDHIGCAKVRVQVIFFTTIFSNFY